MIILSDILILALLALFLFLAVKAAGRIYSAQTWQGPDDEPCETCLRWGECHGEGSDSCPHCIDWRE